MRKLKRLIISGLIGLSIAGGIVPLTSQTNTIEAATVKNGWTKENGSMYYYVNNKKLTGWQEFGKGTGKDTTEPTHYVYFGKDGKLRTGWQELGKGTANDYGENTTKHWSYFGSNGWLRTGWVKLGKGTSEPDGNSAVHYSYFGSNGWLRTSWQEMGKGTSNSYEENTAKHISYFGSNGWLRTGLQNMGKGTSNPDGNNAKHFSYFGSNGWLVKNRLFNAGGKNYSANGSGWASLYTASKFNVGNGRKTIFIGDSRTDMAYQHMYNSNNVIKNYNTGIERWFNAKYDTVYNSVKGIERWYAKFGAAYKNYNWTKYGLENWTINAVKNAEKYLDGSTDVVFLLGYNDRAQNTKEGLKDFVNSKANEWTKKGVKTYVVSINPHKFDCSWIKSYNAYMRNNLNKNVRFIDTYNSGIKFNYENDGVHYKADTCFAIINYVQTHK